MVSLILDAYEKYLILNGFTDVLSILDCRTKVFPQNDITLCNVATNLSLLVSSQEKSNLSS